MSLGRGDQTMIIIQRTLATLAAAAVIAVSVSQTSIAQKLPSTSSGGSYSTKVETPQNGIPIVAGRSESQPTAWIHIANYDGEDLPVASETGVSAESEPRAMADSISPIATSSQCVSKSDVASLTIHHDDAALGPATASQACCISYGNGCYVRCCGGCCAAPIRCPGAGCCP